LSAVFAPPIAEGLAKKLGVMIEAFGFEDG
jgi:hypothetical protein